ncbi:MAG: hypothetical protein II180_04120 [Proteobacteria bacterium]|nr:hypothetical protein [Pseudomonadota bacterium]
MAISQVERDKFWAYVTVFGTLWGGLELTLGTFLHVLHVPKTGFIMCTLSIILLIAQRKIFPARGSSICTAVVAACIKCLSPGGIIAGPVFGILGEALVVELALLIAPTALPAAMIAGALTLTWSQIQSVVKIWIYYGQDFIDGLTKLIVKFFAIEWTSAIGWGLLGLFFGITSICGAVAGLIGSRLGKKVLRQIELDQAELTADAQTPENTQDAPSSAQDIDAACIREASSNTNDDLAREAKQVTLATGSPDHHDASERPETPENTQDAQKSIKEGETENAPKSAQNGDAEDALKIMSNLKGASKRRKPDEVTIGSRAMIAPVALITLIVQLQGELLWSAIALAIWLGALFFKARTALKAIWWPKFWALTLAVSLLSGLILAWDFSGNWAWQTGLEATARMMIRGCYVFSLITWATRAIRPSEVLSFWNKVHLPGLGTAITNAYQILPQWLDLMNDMLKSRPKGKRATLRYIGQCFLLCLVQASRDSESKPSAGFDDFGNEIQGSRHS